MAEPSIIAEVRDQVARIVINRPERRNALDPASRDQLLGLVERARSDANVRALLITGAGDAFCTGADLAGGPPPPPAPFAPPPAGATADPGAENGAPRGIDTRAAAEALRGGAQRLLRTLWELDKPTVAAVAGPAAGMGAHLALCCDFVVMAEGARLIEVFMRRGLVVDAMGAYLLPRLVGMARAKELAYLAEDIGAERAVALGLAHSAVPADRLDEAATALAVRLAKGPTRAIGLTKALLNRSFETSLDQALHDEGQAVALNTQSADMKEGMTAFMQRRPPEFAGR